MPTRPCQSTINREHDQSARQHITRRHTRQISPPKRSRRQRRRRLRIHIANQNLGSNPTPTPSPEPQRVRDNVLKIPNLPISHRCEADQPHETNTDEDDQQPPEEIKKRLPKPSNSNKPPETKKHPAQNSAPTHPPSKTRERKPISPGQNGAPSEASTRNRTDLCRREPRSQSKTQTGERGRKERRTKEEEKPSDDGGGRIRGDSEEEIS